MKQSSQELALNVMEEVWVADHVHDAVVSMSSHHTYCLCDSDRNLNHSNYRKEDFFSVALYLGWPLHQGHSLTKFAEMGFFAVEAAHYNFSNYHTVSIKIMATMWAATKTWHCFFLHETLCCEVFTGWLLLIWMGCELPKQASSGIADQRLFHIRLSQSRLKLCL